MSLMDAVESPNLSAPVITGGVSNSSGLDQDAQQLGQELTCPNVVYGCPFRSLAPAMDEHLHFHCEKQQLKEYILEKEAEVVRLRNELHIKEAELGNLRSALGEPRTGSKLQEGFAKVKTEFNEVVENIKNSEALAISKQKSAQAGQKIRDAFASFTAAASKSIDDFKESNTYNSVADGARRASMKVKESVRRTSASTSEAATPSTSQEAPIPDAEQPPQSQ
ncbi:hypothetical protein CAOG_07805 [Capsaspora owczarzaki ATCC 30864]|uniref:Uncharacterized protein n=1 Tax=Capsaspora owczarzaki (strain ATCC 30864) TaxID=595528 RepID=A0A0D2URW1_CAPO3|nr:hypothetical protein CAOG_07805 [Capsaspora owczarzaki ATCC 30864]KJE97701.1 hypothetical protein CAOG_007805 [Capsaspora owczarzaki ATCC 30864]|eukprot:XP_004342878.1 hypothetical protein CAOG_07805 [Capsaspora owczarzaki ATCC 30864]